MRKKRIAISRDVGTALSITLQIAFSSSVASKFQQKEREKRKGRKKRKRNGITRGFALEPAIKEVVVSK